MSSSDRRGRSATAIGALRAALAAARLAVGMLAGQTLDTYLADIDRQDAVERRLIRFGEALKEVPPGVLAEVSAEMNWSKPVRFRDLAAHWYEGSLDHRVIWVVLVEDLPRRIHALESYLREHGEG